MNSLDHYADPERKLEELITQRDDLLTALMWMEEYFRGHENSDGASKAMFKQARAAIAKANGGAA